MEILGICSSFRVKPAAKIQNIKIHNVECFSTERTKHRGSKRSLGNVTELQKDTLCDTLS